MLKPNLSLRDDFPAVDKTHWQELVEYSLQGTSFDPQLVTKNYEGIELQALYCREDWPGKSHSVEGLAWSEKRNTQSWDLRQEYSLAQPEATNEVILADLGGGVDSLLLILDPEALAHSNSDDAIEGRNENAARLAKDLDVALANVDLRKVAVYVDGGAAFQAVGSVLIELWSSRGVPAAEVRGAILADPIATIARTGQPPNGVEDALQELSGLAVRTSHGYPHVRAVGVDSSPYQLAGASVTQELALAMTTGVQYLRAMQNAGMHVDSAAAQMIFRLSVDTRLFLSIAKLRAARQMWSRILAVSGVSSAANTMQIHSRVSDRVLSLEDPENNLLRNTIGVFAACLGGADAITSIPGDLTTETTTASSRRLARNTALVLREESHLDFVIDPARGSWYLESLTAQLGGKSWELFQQIERQGGIVPALQSGWVAEQISAVAALGDKEGIEQP